MQAVLGHKCLSSTQVYAHTTPAQLAAGLSAWPGVSRYAALQGGPVFTNSNYKAPPANHADTGPSSTNTIVVEDTTLYHMRMLNSKISVNGFSIGDSYETVVRTRDDFCSKSEILDDRETLLTYAVNQTSLRVYFNRDKKICRILSGSTLETNGTVVIESGCSADQVQKRLGPAYKICEEHDEYNEEFPAIVWIYRLHETELTIVAVDNGVESVSIVEKELGASS